MNKYRVVALIIAVLLILSSCNNPSVVAEEPKEYTFDDRGHILTGEIYIDDVYYKTPFSLNELIANGWELESFGDKNDTEISFEEKEDRLLLVVKEDYLKERKEFMVSAYNAGNSPNNYDECYVYRIGFYDNTAYNSSPILNSFVLPGQVKSGGYFSDIPKAYDDERETFTLNERGYMSTISFSPDDSPYWIMFNIVGGENGIIVGFEMTYDYKQYGF